MMDDVEIEPRRIGADQESIDDVLERRAIMSKARIACIGRAIFRKVSRNLNSRESASDRESEASHRCAAESPRPNRAGRSLPRRRADRRCEPSRTPR